MRAYHWLMIVAVLIAITGSSADAGRHTLPKAKISIDLPSSWTITKNKRGLTARSADGGVALVFWETHSTDFKVMTDADQQLGMTDFQSTGGLGTEATNGISWAIRNGGRAKVDKESVLAQVWIGGGKNEKFGVYVLVAMRPTEGESNTKLVETLFKSVRYKP